MANLIFSLSTVLPIFAVMFLGFLLRRWNFLSESFVREGNKLVFRVALPVSLFVSTYNLELDVFFDAKFIAFVLGATLLSFFLVWGIFEWVIKDKDLIGTLVQACYRGNFAILGLPLLHNVIGAENSAKALLVIGFVVPLYNVLAVVILTLRSKTPGTISPGKILLRIVKNPLIIGIAGGFLASMLPFSMPGPVGNMLDIIKDLATPFALICLGGSIKLQGAERKFRYSLMTVLIKTIGIPAVFLILAYLLGFRSYDFVVIMVMLAVPTAVSSYSMVVEMGGDGDIAANSVVFSTFLSVFTLTLFIYLFKGLGVF